MREKLVLGLRNSWKNAGGISADPNAVDGQLPMRH